MWKGTTVVLALAVSRGLALALFEVQEDTVLHSESKEKILLRSLDLFKTFLPCSTA